MATDDPLVNAQSGPNAHHVHQWVLTDEIRKRWLPRTYATFGCARDGCDETWSRTFWDGVPVYSEHDRRYRRAAA